MLDQQHQCDDQQDGQHGGQNGQPPHRDAADLDLGAKPRDIGIGLCQTAGDIGGKVLQQVGNTDGGDHDRHTGGGAQRLIGHLFYHHAQYNGKDEGKDQPHHDAAGTQKAAAPACDVNHNEARDHEHIAVGKVDEPQDAVNHRIADGDKRIQAADGQSRYKDLGVVGKVMHIHCLRNKKDMPGKMALRSPLPGLSSIAGSKPSQRTPHPCRLF